MPRSSASPVARPKAGRPRRQSRSPAIDKALGILELLSREPAGLRMADIARELRLPKSSTHLTLEVLRDRHYIERDGAGVHRLGLKLLEVTSRFMSGLDIRQVARPHLETLTRRTGLTSHLAILDGLDVVYLDRVDGHGLVRFDTYVGKRATVNLTALGKAIAAYLPEQRLDEILRATFRRGTGRAPATPFEFKKQLATFRAAGYTLDDEEDVPGVYCVGAPVRNAAGDVVASVGVIGLTRDLSSDGYATVGKEVRETADSISAQLGYQRPSSDTAAK